LARRRWWAHALAGILIVGSLYAALRVATAQLDPSIVAAGRQLTGRVIVSPGVRTLTPVFNIYGTLALVGGAAWSAWLYFRTRALPRRVIGNILIAVGALLPAIGGSFSRFGLDALLSASELLGVLLIFAGFFFIPSVSSERR
jgi:divalent metal cation (Fe/Co/Zn/Cd) transporter